MIERTEPWISFILSLKRTLPGHNADGVAASHWAGTSAPPKAKAPSVTRRARKVWGSQVCTPEGNSRLKCESLPFAWSSSACGSTAAGDLVTSDPLHRARVSDSIPSVVPAVTDPPQSESFQEPSRHLTGPSPSIQNQPTITPPIIHNSSTSHPPPPSVTPTSNIAIHPWHPPDTPPSAHRAARRGCAGRGTSVQAPGRQASTEVLGVGLPGRLGRFERVRLWRSCLFRAHEGRAQAAPAWACARPAGSAGR